jgi:pyruvate formate lyase activating enzyme
MNATHAHPARWWHSLPDGRIQCDLCPRFCRLKEGQHAFCFVRARQGDRMVLTTYGRSTGFCVDPIEKKPLHHFLPGSAVLSFGTAGCNLGCRFCQNWTISKSREIEAFSEPAAPEQIARTAQRLGCASVAYTYNDPVVFAEYAIDTALACRALGIKNVAVTAGFITAAARAEFFAPMDAANVDLKAFDDAFYRRYCLSHPGGLRDVLDTLLWLRHESKVWLEITTLLIPGLNDSPAEIAAECDWIVRELGRDVPLFFTAFHPAFRLLDRPPTPPESCRHARQIGLERGLRYVYTGNIDDHFGQTTWCPGCGAAAIERRGHALGAYGLDPGGHCKTCGTHIAGVFDDGPGHWGGRRQPVRVTSF